MDSVLGHVHVPAGITTVSPSLAEFTAAPTSFRLHDDALIVEAWATFAQAKANAKMTSSLTNFIDILSISVGACRGSRRRTATFMPRLRDARSCLVIGDFSQDPAKDLPALRHDGVEPTSLDAANAIMSLCTVHNPRPGWETENRRIEGENRPCVGRLNLTVQ